MSVPVVASAHDSPVVSPRVCTSGGSAPYYSFSDKEPKYIAAKNGRVYGQSGVTLTVTKGTSFTVGGSVTGSESGEADAIIAKASVTYSLSFTLSRTTNTTYSGSWKVPKDQETGWLEVGTNNGYTFNWERYHYASPCRKVVEASGKTKVPTKSSAYMYKHS